MEDIFEIVLYGSNSLFKKTINDLYLKQKEIDSKRNIQVQNTLFLDNKEKHTILHFVVLSNNLEKVRHVLIHFPELLNVTNSNNLTAFNLSIIIKNTEITKLFFEIYPELLINDIKSGAFKSIDLIIEHQLVEVLKIVILKSPVRFLEYLKENSKNLLKDNIKDNPDLIRLIEYPETIFVEEMILAIKNSDVVSFNQYISKFSYFSDIENLINGNKFNGLNIINIAFEQNNLDIIKFIVTNYPYILNYYNSQGRNIATEAIIQDCIEVVQFLLTYYPYAFELINKNGMSALKYAQNYSGNESYKLLHARISHV